MKRFCARMVVCLLLTVLTLGGTFQAVQAQDDYPSQPVTLLVGFSAGGSSDMLCRLVAQPLSKILGQPVTVINKPGGSGWVMWSELIRTKPDGYTFGLVNAPTINMGKYDKANPREQGVEDLDLLINHVMDYNVLAIQKDETRFTDLKSFIEYAKKNPVLTSTSAVGILSDDASLVQKMNHSYGCKIDIVQTNGAKDAETMFISKNVDVLFTNISDAFNAYKHGNYKIIAVFAPKRIEIASDIPTAKEQGVDIINYSARGYALPKGVDPAIGAKLMNALEQAIQSPECKDKLSAMGMETVILKDAEYSAFFEDSVKVNLEAFDIKP